MPQTEVRFYQNSEGVSPIIEWLQGLPDPPQMIRTKCDACIRALRDQGHELRRPAADSLRDGIHELRFRVRNVQYRLLYFFHGQERHVAVIAHALTKESAVPDKDIDYAISCREAFDLDPDAHTYKRSKTIKEGAE